MKLKNTLTPRLGWLAAILLGVTSASAASLPLPGKILSFSLAESHVDSTVKAGVSPIQVVTKSTTTVKLTLALGEIDREKVVPMDLTTLDRNTFFTVRIGAGAGDEFSFSGTLGDDPNYRVGNRSAFFPVNLNAGNQKPIGTNGLKLSWTATKLTVSIVRAKSDQNDKGSIYSDELVDTTEPGEPASISRTKKKILVAFGDTNTTRYVEGPWAFLQGSAKTTIKKVGSEEFDLNSIAVTGGIDTKAPVLTLTPPKTGFQPVGGMVTITGKVTDGHGISRLTLRDLRDDEDEFVAITNKTVVKGPPAGADANWWGTTELTWSITIPVEAGVFTAEVKAYDLGDNESGTGVKIISEIPEIYVGRWDVLMNSDQGDPAYIHIITTPTGIVTGKINAHGGISKSLKGTWLGEQFQAFADEGKVSEISVTGAIIVETATSVESVRMNVRMFKELTSDANKGKAFRSPFSASNKIASDSPLLGRFHVATPTTGSPFMGNSYFSLVTAIAGTHVVAGRLADGTTLTASGIIGAEGQVPFFAHVYKKGSFASFQQINPETGAVLPSTCDWGRPAKVPDKQFPTGYNLALETSGQRYTAPAQDTRILSLATDAAEIKWHGFGAETPVFQDLLISTANKIAPVNNAGFSGKIDTAKGLVSGTFKLTPPVGTATFNGIIIGNEVLGHYVAPAPKGFTDKQRGFILLTAPRPDLP